MTNEESENLVHEKFKILLHVINKNNQMSLENALQNLEKEISLTKLFSHEDMFGKRLLDYVSIFGKGSLLQTIESNIEPNKVTYGGYTPLHYAAAWGDAQTVKKLVEIGGDIFMKTFNNERPREIAKRYGHEDCVDFLEWQESKLNLESIISRMAGYLSQPDKVKLLAKDEKLTCQNACAEKKAWILNTPNATMFDYKMHNQQLSHIFGNFFQRFQEADLTKICVWNRCFTGLACHLIEDVPLVMEG